MLNQYQLAGIGAAVVMCVATATYFIFKKPEAEVLDLKTFKQSMKERYAYPYQLNENEVAKHDILNAIHINIQNTIKNDYPKSVHAELHAYNEKLFNEAMQK